MDKTGQIILWLVIMAPINLLFTGIGLYAWKRKKPMWFWAGSTVEESEITDIHAYNRANGIMWLSFSAVFWVGTILNCINVKPGGIILIAANCFLGVPILPFLYRSIYRKYKR